MDILECLKCRDKFSEKDVEEGKFFPSTCICYSCYRIMQNSPITESCFGKKGTKRNPGYDSTSEECGDLCPDRKVCPLFLSGEAKRFLLEHKQKNKLALAKKSEEDERRSRSVPPFRAGSGIYDAFLLCQRGTTIDLLKKWCAKKKLNVTRVLRTMRKEEYGGKRWRWFEESGECRVEFPALD